MADESSLDNHLVRWDYAFDAPDRVESGEFLPP